MKLAPPLTGRTRGVVCALRVLSSSPGRAVAAVFPLSRAAASLVLISGDGRDPCCITHFVTPPPLLHQQSVTTALLKPTQTSQRMQLLSNRRTLNGYGR